MNKNVKETVFWILAYGILIALLTADIVSYRVYGTDIGIHILVLVYLLLITICGRKRKKTDGSQLFMLCILIVGCSVALLGRGIDWQSGIAVSGAAVYVLVVLLLFIAYIRQYPFLKAFQDSQEYLEETKDAEGYRKKCEGLYELAKQKKKKNLLMYRFNVATSMIMCGEYEKAEAMLAEIYDDMQNGKIKYNEMVAGIIYYNRMCNDIFRKDSEHMQQMEAESREILAKAMENQKTAKSLIFVSFLQAVAGKDYERGYEELKKVQKDTTSECSAVVKEHIQFYEVWILRELGRIEESQKKAEDLKQHAKLSCILKQL